jgi:hypothetical protein
MENGRKKRMSNLLDQWNKYTIRGNKLSKELENIEIIIDKSKGEDICFTAKPNGSTYISVLSSEKMQELRESVVVAIMQIRDEKASELEKLMGVRKPAVVNPEFEAAVQDMVVEAPKKEPKIIVKNDPDPVEEKLTDILKGEAKRIEDKPIETDPSLDKYPAKKSSGYPDGMTVKVVEDMYVNQHMTSAQIAKQFGITIKRTENFITIHKLSRKQKKPAETERP